MLIIWVLRRKISLFLVGALLGALLSFSNSKALSAERDPAFRDNLYDVEIQGNLTWIVGYYGTILHSKDRGLTWEVQRSGTQEALFRVSFVDSRKGWISGSYGTVLHTRDGGKTWELQRTPSTEHLFGLNFLDELTGWVVGNRGTVLYTGNGGSTWLDRSLGEDVILNDVAFVDPMEGWVVGEFGRIYRTRDGGQIWLKQKSPIEVSFFSGENRNLFRLLFLAPKAERKSLLTGWAFGLDGVILGTKNGDHWEIVHKDGITNP
ncbi:MAG: YCF48-related protein, partial [Candidatus Binatia bacterium]